MGYMLATFADNTILRAHFAFMAHRNGVSVSDLASATAEGGDTDGGQDLKKVHYCFSIALQTALPYLVVCPDRYILIYVDCRLSSFGCFG